MYEYEVMNVFTGESDIIYGYWFEDACRRRKYNPKEWKVILMEYID